MIVVRYERLEELLQILVERGLVRRDGWRFFDSFHLTKKEEEKMLSLLGSDEDG